jgi:prolyl oligopeptidase
MCCEPMMWWQNIAARFLCTGVLILSLKATPSMAQPPVAPLKPVVEVYHGQSITDHYRYLEDFKSPAVQSWVKQQAEFAERSLAALPGNARLLARIKELDAGVAFTLNGITRMPSGELFYFKQLAAENVAKLYVRSGLDGNEQLLIDPETFPKPAGGGHHALSFYRVSPDAQQVMYGFAASGSEQTTLKVLDQRTGKDLPESIDRLEAEYALPQWLPDGKGFVYSRRRNLPADAPPADGYKFTQAFLHKLGSDPEQDTLILAAGTNSSPNLEEMDFPAVLLPLGSPWAVGQIKHGDETDLTLYVARREWLGTDQLRWTKVCDRTQQVTEFAVRGDDIYLLTAQDAPRFKVVRTSLASPDFLSAEVIVAPSEHVVDSLSVAEDALYVGILAGVPNKILRVPYNDARAELLELPADEPAAHVAAARADLPGVFLSTRSWTRAGKLYQFDPKSRRLVDTGLLPIGKFDAPDWLTSEEVMVPSHDGVKVPLSIIHRRDLVLDGSHPTLLSGYGAYGFTASMRYDPTDIAWLERGGVLAIAHIRGGGAFGKEWHHAGRKLTKPNTWKDFIACAEHLVKQRYTSPAKLAGEGGSAGGILIGRSITERPDLFAAAHISVGCTDMLRFETTLNGPPNVPEFGTTTKDDEFRGLLAMSTLHHIQDGVKYPAVLLTHGINDPRVEPWISAKTTARLQAASASGKPVLFRVDYHAGHGIGSTREQKQAEQADIWAFLLWQFGDTEFQAPQK